MDYEPVETVWQKACLDPTAKMVTRDHLEAVSALALRPDPIRKPRIGTDGHAQSPVYWSGSTEHRKLDVNRLEHAKHASALRLAT